MLSRKILCFTVLALMSCKQRSFNNDASVQTSDPLIDTEVGQRLMNCKHNDDTFTMNGIVKNGRLTQIAGSALYIMEISQTHMFTASVESTNPKVNPQEHFVEFNLTFNNPNRIDFGGDSQLNRNAAKFVNIYVRSNANKETVRYAVNADGRKLTYPQNGEEFICQITEAGRKVFNADGE